MSQIFIIQHISELISYLYLERDELVILYDYTYFDQFKCSPENIIYEFLNIVINYLRWTQPNK